MKREFVINRHGKDYVLYAGLLDVAHQQGLRAIKTQLLQAPAPENGHVAICLAEVTTDKGTFTGIGDADASNVNRMMANALIRMAETRAKARALRDAVNVGLVALEELAEGGTDGASEETGPAVTGRPPPAPGAPPAEILTFPGSRPAAGTRGRPAGAEASAPSAPDEAPTQPAGEEASPAGGRHGAGARGLPGRGGAARQSEAAPLPPTQTQLETIAKLARSTGRTVTTEGLTRAAASELITRLSEERYGARRNS
jgi:hypothetical protein